MKSIILFSSIYATAFILYFLYTHSFGFCLIENIDLLLSNSSGLIVSSKSNDSVSLECSNKTKVRRLTKAEQKQYIIPENLKQVLVGLVLGDLWTNKRGENTRLRFKQPGGSFQIRRVLPGGTCHKDYIFLSLFLFKNFL